MGIHYITHSRLRMISFLDAPRCRPRFYFGGTKGSRREQSNEDKSANSCTNSSMMYDLPLPSRDYTRSHEAHPDNFQMLESSTMKERIRTWSNKDLNLVAIARGAHTISHKYIVVSDPWFSVRAHSNCTTCNDEELSETPGNSLT